jgi:type II secretion system protein N
MQQPEIKSLDHVDYSFGINKFLLLLIIFSTFTISFIFHFPLEEKARDFLKTTFAKSGCPVAFDSLKFEYFLPKIVLKEIEIPRSCLGESGKTIKLDELKLIFRGPSFSPLGLAFRIDTSASGHPFSLLVGAGMSEQVVSIDENHFNLSLLSSISSLPLKLQGKASIQLRAKILENRLVELDMDINSKDFILASQVVSIMNLPLTLPALSLNTLNIKTQTVSTGSIKLVNFILGDTNAPIRTKFTGTINLNSKFDQSTLNLPGEIKLSDQFVDQFSIIDTYLKQFPQKDGFYQLKVSGPLSMPALLPQ